MKNQKAIPASERLIFRLVFAISVVVFLAVVVLNRRLLPAPETPGWAYVLPLLNAILNGTCSVLLILSFRAIKKGNISLHKKLNLTTFALSSVFLISYVIFHYLAEETRFGGEGAIRYFYYTILISHIILAAIVLPLVLLSFYYGLNDDRVKHRKIVRFAFPIWLYVTLTGVLVYLLISPYYPI